MKHVIYKTILDVLTVQEIELPVGSQILSAKQQYDNICLWYKLNPSITEKETYRVYVVPTGQEVSEDTIFLNTILMYSDTVVLHVFIELIKA